MQFLSPHLEKKKQQKKNELEKLELSTSNDQRHESFCRKNNFTKQWKIIKPEMALRMNACSPFWKREWTDTRWNYHVKKRHFAQAINHLSVSLPWNIMGAKSVFAFTEETGKLSELKKKEIHQGLLNRKGSCWAANMSQRLRAQSREVSLLNCPTLTLFSGYPLYNRRQDAGLDRPLI